MPPVAPGSYLHYIAAHNNMRSGHSLFKYCNKSILQFYYFWNLSEKAKSLRFEISLLRVKWDHQLGDKTSEAFKKLASVVENEVCFY